MDTPSKHYAARAALIETIRLMPLVAPEGAAYLTTCPFHGAPLRYDYTANRTWCLSCETDRLNAPMCESCADEVAEGDALCHACAAQARIDAYEDYRYEQARERQWDREAKP